MGFLEGQGAGGVAGLEAGRMMSLSERLCRDHRVSCDERSRQSRLLQSYVPCATLLNAHPAAIKPMLAVMCMAEP